MSDANDDVQNYALAVLAGVVALVVAGVIALAVSTSRNAVPAKPASPAAAAAAQEGQPRVYFEVDSDALPADASQVLNRVAEAARGKPGTTVLISGFHDATGNPEHNADLAKRRAQAVRHALEANGVAPSQLVLDKPQETTGGADAREARRVELRLQ